MSIDEDYDGDYYNSDDDDGIYDYIPEENINIPNKYHKIIEEIDIEDEYDNDEYDYENNIIKNKKQLQIMYNEDADWCDISDTEYESYSESYYD